RHKHDVAPTVEVVAPLGNVCQISLITQVLGNNQCLLKNTLWKRGQPPNQLLDDCGPLLSWLSLSRLCCFLDCSLISRRNFLEPTLQGALQMVTSSLPGISCRETDTGYSLTPV